MAKVCTALIGAVTVVLFFSSSTVFADEPGNPGFEDDNTDISPWTVIDQNATDCAGNGYVINAADPTEGANFGRVSCYGITGNGGSAWGPAFKSSTFFAGSGEEFAVDWRVWADGGYCTDINAGDDGYGAGYLVDASDDSVAATFFDTSGAPITDCDAASWTYGTTATAPADGNYYVVFQVGSVDSTFGTVFGASLDIDNFMSLNSPPDCSAAVASSEVLWPPNHKFHDISVNGVTDVDGDDIGIEVTSIMQDEPTNSGGDGNSCPDADGVGTDTASILAERQGGEFGTAGNGRVYSIYFDATDPYGAMCSGVVKVAVPHSKQATSTDGGPLFDSTQCP